MLKKKQRIFPYFIIFWMFVSITFLFINIIKFYHKYKYIPIFVQLVTMFNIYFEQQKQKKKKTLCFSFLTAKKKLLFLRYVIFVTVCLHKTITLTSKYKINDIFFIYTMIMIQIMMKHYSIFIMLFNN